MGKDSAYRRARGRAAAKLGFYIHLMVYVIVNIFLVAINLMTSPGQLWFYWPLLCWGFGLAFHGFAIFMRTGLMERMTERELEKERDEDQPSE